MRTAFATLFAVVGLFAATIAVADDPKPAAAAAEAPKPAQTRAEQAQAALVDTLQLVTADKMDEWVAKWCDPNTCNGKDAIASYKRYQLNSVKTFGGQCLHGENKDTVQVTRWREDPETTEQPTFYIKCGDRLPVPITVRFEGERVWVTKMSI